MSQSLTDARPVHSGQGGQGGIAALGPRRRLQLALATFWLFDAILQFQPSMFGAAFPRMLAVAVAAAVWLAEGMGGVLTGSGTDRNSGPLLALLALSFWPSAATGPAARGG